MQHKIHGTTLQTLEIDLAPGEMVFSQTHQMAWMTEAVKMDTNTGGGLMKGLMRSLSGASLFLTHFTAERTPGLVAFCPRFPGSLVARNLAAGETLICRKETFLCAQSSVTLDIFFRQQLGAGVFGGEGFVLQKVTGPGWVFLDLSGEVVEKDLKPGEVLLVHVGQNRGGAALANRKSMIPTRVVWMKRETDLRGAVVTAGLEFSVAIEARLDAA